jgi:hypothetical protein
MKKNLISIFTALLIGGFALGFSLSFPDIPDSIDEFRKYFPIPDDPGDKGNESLEGVDENGNGVRDDVERFILEKLPENKALVQAAFDKAVVLQDIAITKFGDLEKEEREKTALELAKELGNKDACLDAVDFKLYGYSYKERKKMNKFNRDLKKKVFNIAGRYDNFIDFNGLLDGKIFSFPIATGRNLDEIIDKYCSENVKNFLNEEQ